MATTTADTLSPAAAREERKVIFASSLGTVFEWYDFYLYGSLAAIIAKQFFSGVNPTAAFIFALLSFAAGFAVLLHVAGISGRRFGDDQHERRPKYQRKEKEPTVRHRFPPG